MVSVSEYRHAVEDMKEYRVPPTKCDICKVSCYGILQNAGSRDPTSIFKVCYDCYKDFYAKENWR
jgi:hypothetical protein